MTGPYYADAVNESETSFIPNSDILNKTVSNIVKPEKGGILDQVGDLASARAVNTDAYVRLKSKGIIDVRKDFVWTVSPKQYVLNKIPTLILEEREQLASSLISSALYYIGAFNNLKGSNSNAATTIVGDLTEKLSGIAKNVAMPETTLDKFKNPLDTAGSGLKKGAAAAGAWASEKIDKGTNFFGDLGEDFIKKLGDTVDKISSTANDRAILGDKLKSYIGLYLTQPTGFKYVLPYFEDKFFSKTNSWKAGGEDSIVKKGIDVLQGAVEQTAKITNILTPGTYIEKPKYYEFGGEGEDITITFPLINTHYDTENKIPYVQNYEFLWILAYQNKPFKTSFSRILPPKLYSVYLPGVTYMPYAYISKLQIDFVGNRRLLPVTLPTGATVNPPIPEAYNVTITVKSLISDVGNIMVDKFFNASAVEVVEQRLINPERGELNLAKTAADIGKAFAKPYIAGAKAVLGGLEFLNSNQANE